MLSSLHGGYIGTLQKLSANAKPEAEQQGDHLGAAQAGGFSLRAAVTPAGRGKGKKPQAEVAAEPSATPPHVAMSWAQRLKRVFGVGIESCARCSGKLKIISRL